MYQALFNPLIVALTFATTFGVLVHDMKIDRATTVALALPAAIISYAAVDAGLKTGDNSHIHVERFSVTKHLSSLRSPLPRLQPRDDDLRNLSNKKVYIDGSDAVSLWPSV